MAFYWYVVEKVLRASLPLKSVVEDFKFKVHAFMLAVAYPTCRLLSSIDGFIESCSILDLRYSHFFFSRMGLLNALGGRISLKSTV